MGETSEWHKSFVMVPKVNGKVTVPAPVQDEQSTDQTYTQR